jgi:hypothetical protein
MTFTLAPRPTSNHPIHTRLRFGFVALFLSDTERYYGIGATKSKAIVDASEYVDDALALDVIPSTARFAMAAAAESEMLPASDWHVFTDTDGMRVVDLRDTIDVQRLSVYQAIFAGVAARYALYATQNVCVFDLRVDWTPGEQVAVSRYEFPYRGTWSSRVAFQTTVDIALDTVESITRRLVMGGDYAVSDFGSTNPEA